MKLIIAGGRDICKYRAFYETCKWCYENQYMPDEYISGLAKGPDQVPLMFKEINKKEIVIEFPANWKEYGKAAGHIRNKQMAEYGTKLLLIWDGESRGSANMKSQMEKLGKPVYEIIIKKQKREVEL